jgi:hypothetical protein
MAETDMNESLHQLGKSCGVGYNSTLNNKHMHV